MSSEAFPVPLSNHLLKKIMKLREYTPENCVSKTGNHTPYIGLNTKSGKISFNLAICEVLKLQKTAFVKFLQDEEDPQNWYLEVVVQGGFEVKQQKLNGYKGRVLRNSTLAKKIADSVDFTGESGRILLAGKPTKEEGRTLYGLIVTTLKN